MPFFDHNGIDLSKYYELAINRGLTYLNYELLGNFFTNNRIMLIDARYLSNINHNTTIVQGQHVDLLIVDMSNHGYVISEDLIQFLKNILGCSFIVLSGDFKYYYTDHGDIIFFPYWLFCSQTFPKNNIIFGSSADIQRKYNIVTTARNLKYRKHRIYFYGKLLQLTTNIRKNFFKYDDFDFNFTDYNAGLTFDEWQKFKNIYDNSPKFLEQETNAIIDTNFDIYTEGYVHVVNETYNGLSFISEKSYKPFLAGQMPMVIGCANIMQMLKDLGFDIFEDIIDYKHYDSLEDYEDRVKKMLELIEYVETLDYQKIFDQTSQRRQKNFEHIHDKNLLLHAVNKIRKKLDQSN